MHDGRLKLKLYRYWLYSPSIIDVGISTPCIFVFEAPGRQSRRRQVSEKLHRCAVFGVGFVEIELSSPHHHFHSGIRVDIMSVSTLSGPCFQINICFLKYITLPPIWMMFSLPYCVYRDRFIQNITGCGQRIRLDGSLSADLVA